MDDRNGNDSMSEFFRGLSTLLAAPVRGTLRVVYVEYTPSASTPAAPPAKEGFEEPGFDLQWSVGTHALIGIMAQMILAQENPEASTRLKAAIALDPLDRGDIGVFARWPDDIKHPPPGRYAAFAPYQELAQESRPWHYVDIPYRPGQTEPPEIPEPDEGTVLTAIPEQLKALKDEDPTTAGHALAFVVHFFGDIHQPLHCSALADTRFFSAPEWDQGGNYIRWGTSQTSPANLHSLWDKAVVAKPDTMFATAEELLARFPRSSLQAAIAIKDPTKWALESHALARQAYDRFLDECEYEEATERFESPGKDYRAWAREVAAERVALAAYRLADALDSFLP